MQTELPALWHVLLRVAGATPCTIAVWVTTGLLLLRLGSCSTEKTSTVVCVLLGLITAQVSAGVQAAVHQDMQVSASCHKTLIHSEFKLLEKTHRENDSQSWLIQHMPQQANDSTSCLKPNARLQVFIEKASRFSEILPGQHLLANLRIKAPRSTLQLEGFDMHQHWFAKQIAGTAELKSGIRILDAQPWPNLLAWTERIRLTVSEWILAELAGHPEQPLVMAMVVGDQGLIGPEDREMYSATGIAHLVAISGLHITMLAMLAGKLAGCAWRCSSRLCLLAPAPLVGAGFGLVFGLAYGLIAGWGVPAQRTVFMLAALFAGQLRGGIQNGWDSFFLALFLTITLDSWAILDAGFLLSFGAIAVLIFSSHGHFSLIKYRFEFIRNAVKAQYAVTVGLVLPTALLFNQQSLISPVVNALSIPWMSFLSTPLALLGGLLQQGWALSWAAESLSFQRHWLEYFNGIEWAVLPIHSQPAWVYLCVGMGCLILLIPAGIVNRGLGLALLGFLVWPAERPETGDFWLTLMDVGQGTAVAIQTHRHLLLYDAGPAFNQNADSSRRVILPWLARNGYQRADLFILSHDDADHAGGAPLLISKAPPMKFASPLPHNHHLNEQARKQHSKILQCHDMPAWQWDGVFFQPMALIGQGTSPQKPLAKNNQSCVLKISNLTHSVLLTGDIEAPAEMQLLTKHGAAGLKARVLLAPHHGSRTSSTLPFLQAVEPDYVLVQSGWQNQFRHPHPLVTARYESIGSQWFNTAQHGAARWEFHSGHQVPHVINALESRRRYWHLHENGASP